MQMDAPTQLRRVCELRLERWATLSGVMMASGAPLRTKMCEKPDVVYSAFIHLSIHPSQCFFSTDQWDLRAYALRSVDLNKN